jgi:biopolymer transport protein ExbB/TolQ
MRKPLIIAVFFCLMVISQLSLAQDTEPLIKVDEASATFEKISNNNFKLIVQWNPFPGAHRYRIRYIDIYYNVIDDVDQLTKSRLTENEEPSITLTLENNTACFQVIALDEAGGAVGESCIYRATMSFGPTQKGTGMNWVFPSAFLHSFEEMDPLAGWAIVASILLMFVYGSYMAYSINQQIKKQNHIKNPDLNGKVIEYKERWKEAANERSETKLSMLLDDISKSNSKKYCIFNIFEKGLANHLGNIKNENCSQEVDRDMEKSIVYELEKIKLGKFSKKEKHITLNRIKMFGETSPMLGLLGTVSGLIVAFFNILNTSKSGGAYEELLQDLSSGIYSAIVTTIFGLIFGIALLFIHHGVESNIKRLQNEWLGIYIDISEKIS